MLPQQITTDVLLEKYAKNDEKTADDIFKRVAKGVAAVEQNKHVEREIVVNGVVVKKSIHEQDYWEGKFYENMKQGALGAGRIMSAAGTDVDATLINCFSGDTVALTDQGPKTLKDLSGSFTNVMTLEGWKRAEIKNFGIQRIYEVLFSTGQKVKTTAGHDWLVTDSYEWRDTLNNLTKVKTTELVNRNVPIIKNFTRPVKDEEYNKGIVHGIVYGDGSKITNRNDNAYYLYLFNQKMNLSKFFEKYSQRIDISDNYSQESKSIYGVKLGETNLKKPPSLENHSLSYIYGFICGLIATDGNVCSIKGNVTIFQSNHEELEEISKLVPKVGMNVTSLALYRKYSPFDGSVKPCYVLRIRRNSNCEEDFIREDQKNNFNLKENNRIQTQTAILITDTGIDEEVYCAVEPETHSFVIEGNILTGNCFTVPVGDSITGKDEDGYIGIYDALTESAETLRRGGGVGYDFSLIRPKNAKVGKVGAFASGPCSYMNIFNSSCETIESAGARRGAQMGSMRIDHPDIEEFIKAKRTEKRWSNFNVSVFVSDAFMNAKNNDKEIDLFHKAEPTKKLIDAGAYKRDDGMWVYKKIKARELWDLIMKSNYDYAEPGILFADNINNDNNLRYCEKIRTTNPCVTGDTVILTDRGYIRIDTIVDQEIQIWNGFEWSFVTPKVTGENQEIIDFEFSDGTKLSCTPYHKFILADGTRIEAKDLHLDSKLAKFNFPIIEGNIDVDDKLAYTQGFYSGDGQKETNRIWLYNEKCNLVNKLSVSAFSDQSTDSVKRIMASLDYYPPHKDFVPDNRYKIKVRLNWLAGLIDSDGSVQDKTVTIWSVDKSFLSNIKLMLNTLGVSGTVSIGRTADKRSMPDGRNGFAIYDTQDCWRISISGSNITKLKELGLNTFRVDISGITNRESSRFIQPTFKQKRQFLEPKVYCFNEEKNHSGIFNGIMTAQCAEQPLPDYGCCDLGPIDLTKFVINAFKTNAEFLFEPFKEAVRTHVRFLDNVLDVTLWPLKKQQIEAQSKRRIGIGFTGLGNTLAMMNYKYSEQDGVVAAAYIGEMMRDTAYSASVELAKERGAFPLFDANKYLEEGTFASRLPDDIKNNIREFGIRNSHLLSIAPVGTVSLAFCDNASNGIEPPFSLTYIRQKRNSDGTKTAYPVVDHSLRVFLGTLSDKLFADAALEALLQYRDVFIFKEVEFKLKDILPPSIITAMEMTPDEHLRIMKAVQPYIDSSMSKTVNIPADYPFEDFKTVYDQAWQYKLKGVATYRPNNILGSVLSVGETVVKEEPKKEIKNPDIDPLNIVFNKRPLGDLNAITKKVVYSGPNGDGSFYVSISFIEVFGSKDNNGISSLRPIEIFVTTSPDDVPAEWVAAYARNLSLLARSGLDLLAKALQDGRNIKSDKGRVRYGWYEKADGNKVPRFHGSEVACIAYAVQEILMSHGYIDTEGNPLKNFKDRRNNQPKEVKTKEVSTSENLSLTNKVTTGKACPECGDLSLIRKDGCQFCTSCGYEGACG